MRFVKPERISLALHTEFREQWVQDRIAGDPSILGLGDLILRDRERVQPNAGRLDLLLQHPDLNQRYEVEIQLGSTNESHIIRTIEYWDIERRRYPQYDHCAVIVAEDITSRFLNVIGLFNSQMPLIALQMRALKFEDIISLVFTTVMNRFEPGLPDEEDGQSVGRDYWENKMGTPATVAMADKLLGIIGSFAPGFKLNYTKSYIGLTKDGRSQNFALFRPRKGFLNLNFWLERSDEIDQRLESAGLLDVTPYDDRWARYRLRLTDADLKKHGELLEDLLRQSYANVQNA